MRPLVAVSLRPSIPAAPDAVLDRHLGEGYRAADLRRLAGRFERRYSTDDRNLLDGFRIVALSGSDGLAAQTRVEMLRVPGAWRLVGVELPESILPQREQVRLVAARRFLSGEHFPAFCRRRGWLHPDKPVDLTPRTLERHDRERAETDDREDAIAMQDLVL